MKLTARAESWPIKGEFRISRGAKTAAEIIIVEIEMDGCVGRGEGVPYARYGETIAGALNTIRTLGNDALSLDSGEIRNRFPAGAARNAVDCAAWDLRAKLSGKRAWQLAGLPEPKEKQTFFTISMDHPDVMHRAAANAAGWPLLKVKLDHEMIDDRIASVHEGAPHSKLLVDANESWSIEILQDVLSRLPSAVVMIEQPLPAGADHALRELASPIPLCADESAHGTRGLDDLENKYQAVNIKLDKTGGLTEAISVAHRCKALDLSIMLGCMVGTSLGMAPAMMLSGLADFVDLDGPLLLARDRTPSLRYGSGGNIFPPHPRLWG